MTQKCTLSFLMPTGRCLGFKPDGLVKVNLHITNNIKQTQESKLHEGGTTVSSPASVQKGFMYLLSLFLEMDDKGNVSYRTVWYWIICRYTRKMNSVSQNYCVQNIFKNLCTPKLPVTARHEICVHTKSIRVGQDIF